MASLIYGNNGNINKFVLGYEETINSDKPSSSGGSSVSKTVSKTPSSGQTINQKHVHCTYCKKNGHLKNMCFVYDKKKRKFPFVTNKKGPKKIWVSKDKIIYVVDMLNSKVKTPIMVPRQWLLTTHDMRKACVPRAVIQR